MGAACDVALTGSSVQRIRLPTLDLCEARQWFRGKRFFADIPPRFPAITFLLTNCHHKLLFYFISDG